MAQTLITAWEHYFRPETRSTGRSFFSKGAVRLIQPSDTEIQAYIQGAARVKVQFKMDSVSSPRVRVSCSCPNGKKSQLCKHIWAVLLQIESSKPDFLDGKKDIQIDDQAIDPSSAAPARTLSPDQVDSQTTYKMRQEEYRKEAYERQKQRAKEKKASEKSTGGGRPSKFLPPELAPDLAAALVYFSDNGVPLALPLEAAQVNHAKKILSRVFHPDKGGTHQEILELNKNCDIVFAAIAQQR